MKLKKFFCVIGIISGIISVVFGITVGKAPTGRQPSTNLAPAEFGADFYTYTYNGIKKVADNTDATAENIVALAEIISKGTSYLLISAGVFQISLFGLLTVTEQQASVNNAGDEEKKEQQT